MGLPRRDPGLAGAPVDAPAHPALPRQAARTLPGLSGQHRLDAPGRGQDLGAASSANRVTSSSGPTGRGSPPAGQQGAHGHRRARPSYRGTARHRSAAGRRERTPPPGRRQGRGPRPRSERTSGRPPGSQPARPPGAAQAARSIERMEPGLDQVRGISDVMQPRRCDQVIRQAQRPRHPPCPGATDRTCRQRRGRTWAGFVSASATASSTSTTTSTVPRGQPAKLKREAGHHVPWCVCHGVGVRSAGPGGA